MSEVYFIVHKTSHLLHRIGGCKYTLDYSKNKYDEYETVEKAIAKHFPDIRSCKLCVNKKALDEIKPKL